MAVDEWINVVHGIVCMWIFLYLYTGWTRKNWASIYEDSHLRLQYIFKTPESISMIFGTLQCRFILNTSVNSIFNKFIVPCHLAKVYNSNFVLTNATRRSITYLAVP